MRFRENWKIIGTYFQSSQLIQSFPLFFPKEKIESYRLRYTIPHSKNETPFLFWLFLLNDHVNHIAELEQTLLLISRFFTREVCKL